MAGYLSLSIITNLTGCYIGFFVVGFGCGLGGMIPASIILTAWFRKKRGFALSIASMASALATVIYPKLILLVLNRYSIFSAYRLLALSVAMMVILAFCLVRDCPQDKGMLPYGQDEAEHFDIAVTKNRRSVLALLQKKSILCLLGTGILLGGMINSISAHISILYISEGYDSEFAASMVSLFGIVMLVVKPVYGILVDWFGLRKMSMVSLIMLALSTCIPMCFHLNIAMPYLFVILYGCTSPLTATVFPLWSDVLGAEGGGVVSVYPIYRVCTSVGAIIASTVPGYMADQFGSYVSVFYVYFFLCVISFIVIDRLFRYIRYQEE